jgi:hypothetical protein
MKVVAWPYFPAVSADRHTRRPCVAAGGGLGQRLQRPGRWPQAWRLWRPQPRPAATGGRLWQGRLRRQAQTLMAAVDAWSSFVDVAGLALSWW